MQEYIEFFARHPFLSAIWFVLFFAVIYTIFQSKFSKFTKINAQQLTIKVNREDAVVLDIRAAADFNKGHIAGAINLTPEQAASGHKNLEKNKSKPIIVVCQAGMTATKTANQLVDAGYEQVDVLDGGMNSWSGANLPVAKG
ncbi:rhodanese-like domain-containing protein [Catenovulum maritimum]|uniref:Rhodanese domain-containing protein n=1 Tax=Catenovulum maritimum TaxID=1513271 RepID=A0A0J8JJC7_9ALTE|nr:rhodanese-like domain-containing protein [Catenovulum maritimum]KMT64531.1 hypothetical protein XM47_13815 [Catenovulum maritimum]